MARMSQNQTSLFDQQMPDDLRDALDDLDWVQNAFDELVEGDMIEPMCKRLTAARMRVDALIAYYKVLWRMERESPFCTVESGQTPTLTV